MINFRDWTARHSRRKLNPLEPRRRVRETGPVSAGPKPVYSVSVRELVQFVLRRGDLGGAREFVGADRNLAGIRGHQRIQRSRPAGYRKEVAVAREITTDEITLRLHGRIDGLLATESETWLEEIKTVRGSWDGIADPLHWAQAKIYAFIHASECNLPTIRVQLTYLNLESEAVTEFHETLAHSTLAQFFDETITVYLGWIEARHRWIQQRNQSIAQLAFPFPNYRAGQRKLAVAVYQTLASGGRLFAEAPTGIGKTMATLFPAMKALAEGKLDTVFYLTARTIGRAVAEKTMADLRAAGMRARAVTLTARDKVCVRNGQPCDLNTCPLAIGYYDRCKPAIRAALEREAITRPVLEEVAQEHQVCPFELSLDVSLWVDAVICDFNYVFDPQAFLRRHFAESDRRHALLVDEAHNLVDRAREMFSADLTGVEIDEVRRELKKTVPRCARKLAKLSLAIRKLPTSFSPNAETTASEEPRPERELFVAEPETPSPAPVASAEAAIPLIQQRGGILTTSAFPAELLPLVEECLKECEAWLAQNQPASFREALLQLYFRLRTFSRTTEFYDECYVTMIAPGASVKLRLFCLDPSKRLREAGERGCASVFFSGTLTPMDYYRNLLGGAEEDRLVQLASPFAPENLAVLVQPRIRTDLKSRSDTLAEVVAAIGAAIEARRGNYLVYLPSFQYLRLVPEPFQSAHPGVTILEQHPGMTEAERETFLVAFATGHEQTLVGFVVLGGIFGESIDLVGERLIGAIVVGVGLPQLSAERDLIRDHFQRVNGLGFDYAYTFPGMNRVLQAVGRVIRSETDRGVVLLIDRRFAEARYRRLFPAHWRAVGVGSVDKIREAADQFWSAE